VKGPGTSSGRACHPYTIEVIPVTTEDQTALLAALDVVTDPSARSRPDQRIVSVYTLIDELWKMTPEKVAALSDSARLGRRQYMRGDDRPWSLTRIEQVFGVAKSTAAKWRWSYLRNPLAVDQGLPAPIPDKEVRQPGHFSQNGRAGQKGAPRWRPVDVLTWGEQCGRLDADYFKARRTSPGRPRTNPDVPQAVGVDHMAAV
jgi:hypothetical protein